MNPLANEEQAVEVPIWDRAHRTLNSISEDMRARLNEIEHAQARLAGEADAVRSVLARISPPPPQPIGAGYAQQAVSAAPRVW